MSAARIVANAVRRAVPRDYDVRMGQLTQDDPDERAVSVVPLGGEREIWGPGSNVPRMVRTRVRVRLRALANDGDWLDYMSDRVRYAVLATGNFPTTVGRLYFGNTEGLFFPDVERQWTVVRVQTWASPRLTEGRRYSLMDTDFRVIMRPLPSLPVQDRLTWPDERYTVFEQAGDGFEVARSAVRADRRAIIGGALSSYAPGPLTNPADEAFPAGAPQGAFPAAEAGMVLWRNLNVGVDGSNLFDATTTNDVPEAEGGTNVRLLRIVANADDSVDFVTREEFGKDLADNGIFVGRAGGVTWLFRLAGAPTNIGGDLHYRTTPAGFVTANAVAEASWDWAFVDGSTWRPEPWQSEPPAGARWTVTVRLTDGQGGLIADVELPRDDPNTDAVAFPVRDSDGEPRPLAMGPIAAAPGSGDGQHDGVVVQRLIVTDVSPGGINARSRYTVAVEIDGLVVHGEPTAAADAPRAREHGPGWSEAYA